MTDTTPNYNDLRIEDHWIDYLRTRLPYSFNRIEEKGHGRSRYFGASEPVLLSGPLAAERHNFWRRGNVYYMSGKLLDYFSMTDVGQRYRTLEVLRLCTDATARYVWPVDPFSFYNSMQMEKVWGFARSNHLDRERVMMTSVTQGVELCLKAIMTHASFRETKGFKFNAGHDIAKLYEDLPDSLRVEIAAESEVFAKDYLAFREKVEAEFQRIKARSSQPQGHPDAIQQAEEGWEQIAKRIRESNYTAFLNSTDPGADEKYLREGWFEEALNRIKLIKDFGDISQYIRYAPQKDKDELPTDLIHCMLLLGRFMYEHLFPVPPSESGPFSGFPIQLS